MIIAMAIRRGRAIRGASCYSLTGGRDMKKKRLMREDGRYVLLYSPCDAKETELKESGSRKSEYTKPSAGEDEKSV